MNEDFERKMEGLKKWMEEEEGGARTIIGNFNVRTGEEGGWRESEDWKEERKSRKSKDKKVNKEDKKLV